MNVCGACGLDFSSVRAFDGHRVGRHAYTSTEGLRVDPPREDGRRCLVAHELVAAGFAQDARGRWGMVNHRLAAVRRFSVDPVTEQRDAGQVAAMLRVTKPVGPDHFADARAELSYLSMLLTAPPSEAA